MNLVLKQSKQLHFLFLIILGVTFNYLTNGAACSVVEVDCSTGKFKLKIIIFGVGGVFKLLKALQFSISPIVMFEY